MLNGYGNTFTANVDICWESSSMSLFKRQKYCLTWLVLGLSVASLIMRSIVSTVMLQNITIQNMMLAYTVSPFFF